jgi:hypothetical protein
MTKFLAFMQALNPFLTVHLLLQLGLRPRLLLRLQPVCYCSIFLLLHLRSLSSRRNVLGDFFLAQLVVQFFQLSGGGVMPNRLIL